jgi:hypothetical protein
VPAFPSLLRLDARDQPLTNRALQLLSAGRKLKAAFVALVPWPATTLLAFAAYTPNLRKLWLGSHQPASRDALIATLPRWPQLRSLIVQSNISQDILLLAAAAPNNIVSVKLSDRESKSTATFNRAQQQQKWAICVAGQLTYFPPKLRVKVLHLQYCWVRAENVRTALAQIAPALPSVLLIERSYSDSEEFSAALLQEACAVGCEVRLLGPVAAAVKAQFPSVVYN